MADSWFRRIFARRTTDDNRYPAEHRIPIAGRGAAGIRVTAENSISVSTVWGCLRYISQTIAVLPWHVHRPTDRGNEKAPSHPIEWLVYQRPNPEWSSFQFRETLTHWALRFGNGYAEIETDSLGRPIALWPIHPSRVQPWRDVESGRLFYRIFPPSGRGGEWIDMDPMSVFHIRGFGDDIAGVSVMDYAAESIGWAKAAQLFGAAFFGQGMNVTGVVQSKRPFKSDDMLNRLKAGFRRMYQGVRGDKVMFLDDGMEFKPIGIEPEKAQFLETNQYLVSEICRWFGVPPHKVADLTRSTFSNIESQTIEVVVDCIGPWVKRFEDEATYKLFGAQNRQGFVTKMHMAALLRGDSAARSTYYKELWGLGCLTIDDILSLEDMNTIGGKEGAARFVNQQYLPLDRAMAPPPAPAAADPSAPPVPANDPGRPAERAAQAAIRAMAEVELV